MATKPSYDPVARTLNRVLAKAEKAFARYDRLRNELRATEAELTRICREYDLASGCRGIRPEGVRFAIETRRAKRAA